MNVSKLLEVIAELEQQKRVINDAISRLKQVVATLNGQTGAVPSASPAVAATEEHTLRASPPRPTRGHRRGSHFSNAIEVLKSAGGPLHIDAICGNISRLTGNDATRGSVDGAISRHIRGRGDESTIVRTGPGTYALRALIQQTETTES